MALKIKFPLNMADGSAVRTIEELREHFDLMSVLSYYSNGKLINWLESRYYDEEAQKVKALDSASEHFKMELCAILGVNYSDYKENNVELKDVEKKNERVEILKKYTADDTILEAADRVAFSQEELEKLLVKGVDEIYLLGEQFTIPLDKEGIMYIGVNKPKFSLSGSGIEKDIEFKNMDDLSYIYAKMDLGYYIPNELSHVLEEEAEKGSLKAQHYLGQFYYDEAWRHNSPDDYDCDYSYDQNLMEKAVKCYRKAAEQGYADAQCKLGACYLSGEGVEEDKEEAKRWYHKGIEQYKLLAKQGDVQTQGKLGDIYDELEDYTEAVKWYKKAAEQGDVYAQGSLAYYYRDGKGVEANGYEAKKWFDKTIKEDIDLAEKGEAEAQFELGRKYSQMRKVTFSKEEKLKDVFGIEAVKWYKKAADQGYQFAQYNLGKCYFCGDGINENKQEGFKWYKKAAEQGHAFAIADVAICYEDGEGVEKNDMMAKKWFSKAEEKAEQGNTDIFGYIGKHYYCKFDLDNRMEVASKWFEKAVEHGDTSCQAYLDSCKNYSTQDIPEIKIYNENTQTHEDSETYFNTIDDFAKEFGISDDPINKDEESAYDKAQAKVECFLGDGALVGVGGEEPNHAMAVNYYRKGAKYGSAYAEFRLGFCYYNGFGVDQNYNEAVKWYKKAAEQNNLEAQYNLGICYINGEGIEENFDEGLKLIRKAANQGLEEAQKTLKEHGYSW